MRPSACGFLTVLLLGCTAPAASPDAMPEPDLGRAPAWTTLPAGMAGGAPRWGMPLQAVPSERRFVGFGGTKYPDGGAVAETWSLSMRDQSWTRILEVTEAPKPRYCHCLAYLPDTNELLLVGGRNDEGPLPPAAFTLSLATRAWSAVAGELPTGVIGCHAAWVPERGRAFVFGGGNATGLPRDTFAYDPATHTFAKLAVENPPPGRMDGVAAYDPGDGGRMLMWGGATSVNPSRPKHLDDLWAFDGTTWTQLAVAAGPRARRVPAAAFDGARRQWVVFGGTVETEDLADLWRLDVASLSWTQLDGSGAPSPRGFASAAYDDIADAYLVAGGLDQQHLSSFGDAWLLALP